MQYSSPKSYDFKLNMQSKRCRLVASDAEDCPGNIEECERAGRAEHCLDAGGTTVTVQFRAAPQP